MSEDELSRKERLVSSIKERIRQLVLEVQNDAVHLRFKPGYCWWIATIGTSEKEQYPDGVHFCDQIGVSQEDFKFALGKKWLSRKDFPFSALRIQKARSINFVSVGLSNFCSYYGSEVKYLASDSSLIVSSSSSSPSWTITVRQLLRSIEERVTPIPVRQPTLMHQEPGNRTSQLLPPPSIASTITESPRLEQQTPSASQIDLVATNPTSLAVPAVHPRIMSENELSRKERLVSSIKERIRHLVLEVQNDAVH
jgi:hypothetical protein